MGDTKSWDIRKILPLAAGGTGHTGHPHSAGTEGGVSSSMGSWNPIWAGFGGALKLTHSHPCPGQGPLPLQGLPSAENPQFLCHSLSPPSCHPLLSLSTISIRNNDLLLI